MALPALLHARDPESGCEGCQSPSGSAAALGGRPSGGRWGASGEGPFSQDATRSAPLSMNSGVRLQFVTFLMPLSHWTSTWTLPFTTTPK